MNENDINILLDHFVDGLDASESATIIQKINTRPAWSDTYQKISRVFGSLSTVREQNHQQQAPTGLAHKTFQKILEMENAKKVNCNFFAQKETVTVTGSDSTKSHKTNLGIKPSFLALCTCTGFLFVMTAWFFTTNFGSNNQSTQTPTIAQNNLYSPPSSQKSVNYGMEFALTGASRNSKPSPFFNSSIPSCSATVMNCSASNKQTTVNAPDKLVCLNDLGNSKVAPHYKPVGSKIACPDGYAVFVSQTEAQGQPLIIVSSSSTSSSLLKEQKALHNAGNTQDNISIPVFYRQ